MFFFLIWCAHGGVSWNGRVSRNLSGVCDLLFPNLVCPCRGGVAASILGEAFEALTFNIFVHHMCLGIWCAHSGLCVVGDTTLEHFEVVKHFF